VIERNYVYDSRVTFGALIDQGTRYVVMRNNVFLGSIFENGENAEIASYTLDVVYTPVPCGDGVVGFGEQCDDSNANAGDGCSSTCQLENSANEVEPNEDGMTATGTSTSNVTGNDFASANADANGAFTTSKRIIAKLSPAGDEDVFAFTNPTAGALLARFDTWNLAPGTGIGVPCNTSSFDTGINIRDASGTQLATNDDRNGTSDRCSGLTFQMAPGQTIYAHVVEQDDNTALASYVLDVVYTPIVCGDGIVGPTEQCDDMNTMDGDGCSSTCQWEVVCGNGVLQAGEQCDDANLVDNDGCSATCTIENVVSEVEPSDTTSDAAINTVQIAGDMFVSGAIGSAGDVDVFQVTVATATTVRFETFTTWGDCSTATLDVRLFDSSSNPVVSDLEGTGINECGAITTFLAAGTYYVQVEERGSNVAVAAYLLQAAFQSDSGNETEPNETTAQASTGLAMKNDTFIFGDHMSFGDIDVYAITVPPNARIRAEIIEGNAASETCESGGVDSRLLLLDDNGTLIAEDNDSGRGFCSVIDGTGTTPLDATARNSSFMTRTYYLMVRASAFATTNGGQFVYRLQLTVR
jgi:cysteine-rich repeat protein